MYISELETPSLIVDLDRLERNVRRVAEYSRKHGFLTTPHIKTHKSVNVARLQSEEGAVGLACAKLSEAEVMIEEGGLTNVLVAYPIVGEAKLAHLVSLAGEANVSVALDSVEVAEGISRAAHRGGVTVGVLAEVNTGTNRCGLPPGPDLIHLCRRLMDLPGLDYQGLMTYQGHLSGTKVSRDRGIEEEIPRLEELYALLEREGIPFPLVSAASSPNWREMHRLPGITHVRHGTYVFNDRNTLAQEACSVDDCALTVAVTVVSASVPGQIIIDGGSKTFSSDRLALGGEGHGLCVEDPALTLVKMNEEHGYVDVSRSDRRYRVGDRLHFIPNHVCTCVNMHNRFFVHREGHVVDEWPVDARGMVW